MAGRVVLTVLALITVLLAVVAIPLGLLTAAQERRDFRDETAATAAAAANTAEELIGDGVRSPVLPRLIRQLAARGERVGVYDQAGRLVLATAGGPPAPVARAGQLVVSAPIISDSGAGSIGRVVLARPTDSLHDQIQALWLVVAAVCTAGLLIAGAVAAGLARWVSRPLATLAGAARDLGGGSLGARAGVVTGPAEVRRLSETFDTMAARLQSLVHGHQTMMADVAHQVRTPLAALRLRLDLLAQDTDAQTATELAGAQEEIARLNRLVSGVLAVARAESVTVAPERVAVSAVLRDRAAAWGPAAEEHGVTLTVAGTGPVTALAGPGHLEQILDNLLANALDAVPEGGTVQVGAAPARPAGDGWVARITVCDDGPGMSAEQQQAAFRRFASGAPGGTGLGLAIVDRLATANGGRAALSDRPGGGLTVTVDLPLPRPAGRRGTDDLTTSE
jgi:signal transduction histidine kinase